MTAIRIAPYRGVSVTGETVMVEADRKDVSDGIHNIDELYAHRCACFIAFAAMRPQESWWATADEEGWLLVGIRLPSGDVSYHVPPTERAVVEASGIPRLPKAPPFDGHSSDDVLQRIRAWISGKSR